MPLTQSCIGIIWTFLSLIAAILFCIGFFTPFWIKGEIFDNFEIKNITTYFSSFRRCNYPKFSIEGHHQIAEMCGGYTRFYDIPTIWWQMTTLFVGLGCSLSIFCAVKAIIGLCWSYVIDDSSAKTIGFIQLISVCFSCLGGVVYPMGWNHIEIQEACGYISGYFQLGSCELGWSMYVLFSSNILMLLCSALSRCSVKSIQPS